MKKCMLIIAFQILLIGQLNSQNWINLGATYTGSSPYPYKYFLLLDMNGFNGDINAEFEVLVFADDNYMYHSRSSIFVSRHSGTTANRLDGVSLNYLSGKPGMLEVLVKNNQVWMRATQKWGSIKYRMIDHLNHGSWTTPLTSQTVAPTNTVASSNQPFYYDFDASIINHYPSLLPNGNVGIGTTTPDSKLTVKGNIHAQEVKVTVNAGADFVFNEGYKLPSLKEVEQFIKENKHLPEIASEKEMQANGMLLADMNIRLLQKIEELTLYTINQEKKIDSQDEQLNSQSNAIKKLDRENELLKSLLNRVSKLEEQLKIKSNE